MVTPSSGAGPVAPIQNVAELEEALSRPTAGVVEDLARLDGDIMILGVGGKMGPTLAKMARRAIIQAGSQRAVIGVARFSQPALREELEAAGVRTIACDLLDREAVLRLPDAGNVIFMAGMKFGSTGSEARTWAMNAYMPGVVAERYRTSRLVVFSTGNIYPFMPVYAGGAVEEVPPAPIGEYAQSALGRERVFEHFSRQYGTPTTIYRLNYAVELRYGILLDIAQKVWTGTPIDVTMGNVNAIWQGDANAAALRCLNVAQTPPVVLNVTGPETISVRRAALRLGELLEREPIFTGQEAENALLSNAAKAHRLFGYPTVALDTVLQWVAHWVKIEGPTLNKPTHFDTRDGKF